MIEMFQKTKKTSIIAENGDATSVATATTRGHEDGDARVGLQKTGTKPRVAFVPKNDFAKLSYYLKCMACLLTNIEYCELFGTKPSRGKKLIHYKNAHKLPQKDKDTILRLATEVFDPETINGKLIMRDHMGLLHPIFGLKNDFFHVVVNGTCGEKTSTGTENGTGRIVEVNADPKISLLVGRHPRSVTKVMIYKQAWLNIFYYRPIRNQAMRIAELKNQSSWTIPSCVVAVRNDDSLLASSQA